MGSSTEDRGSSDQGLLVTWGCEDAPTHQAQTHMALARHAAELLRRRFGGRLEDAAGGDGAHYCIPRSTLFAEDGAVVFGAAGPDPARFFGGWVPAGLLATKAIVHPLAPGETPPEGWPAGFAAAACDVALVGASAFTLEGAAQAGRRLLDRGPVRIKAVGASGGVGQFVARSQVELDRVLERVAEIGLLDGGLVLEEHLENVKTYSVGEVMLGDLHAAYVGTQDLTSNNAGEEVYGGSRLFVARGGYPELLKLVPPEVAKLCAMAMRFDQLAERELGLVASRRNYDIIVGTDHAGEQRSAVLEQSWRVGGASPAELAALEVFDRDPARRHVIAASVERYGAAAVLPENARPYFHGTDAEVGPILKYASVQDAP